MDQKLCSELYSWFEQCGVISDVRTHLRQNLIRALKSKDLNLGRINTPKSAKQYVHDLLIAEYLLNHNYVYTLSVFASEAPLLLNFHTKEPATETPGNAQCNKLRNDYVLHAMETIGINPNSSKGKIVISEYEGGDTPLLLCILESLSRPLAPIANGTGGNICVSNKYSQTHNSHSQPSRKVALDTEKLVTAKERLIEQKKVFDGQLKAKEARIKQQAAVVNEKLLSLHEKMREMQNIMHSIELKEKDLSRIKEHHREHDTIRKQENILLNEKNRDCRQDPKKLKEDLVKIRWDLYCIDEAAGPRDATEGNADIQATPFLQRETVPLNDRRKVEQMKCINCKRGETFEKSPKTVFSESSSTEDILQDAKVRLKKLEEESFKADHHYYKFINTR